MNFFHGYSFASAQITDLHFFFLLIFSCLYIKISFVACSWNFLFHTYNIYVDNMKKGTSRLLLHGIAEP
ncbi:hypothetical protein VNO78_28693 [Psophocarpus tetragonolobus]|uniref:Uncharacterized protein n=1 Tax=Psophocarpus tetragonolobus TaxID=3891 RepID=A0AAN9RTR2_PSOTE